MRRDENRASRRREIEALLRQIDDQRRQQLLLEAAGAQAPRLEREAARTRQALAELVREPAVTLG